MAAAAAIGRFPAAAFLVGPIAAIASLVLCFLVGRELGLPPRTSAAATAVLASCPIFFGMAIQPMRDALAAAWVLAAIFFALRARGGTGWAIAAGAAIGIAILVRPTNVLAAPALCLALPPRRRTFAAAVAGGAPFSVLFAAYNLAAFGNATATGYGSMPIRALSAANVVPQLRHFGYWIPAMMTPLVPLAWAALARDRQASRNDRGLLLLWFGGFFAFYAFYEVSDDWWSTRFLLPGIPTMILAAALVARDGRAELARRGHWVWRCATGLPLLFGILAVSAGHIRRFDLLSMHRGEKIYRDASSGTAALVPRNALVASMQMSGALKYYTPLPIVRWDLVYPTRFPGLRRTAEEKGFRWYSLVWTFEEEGFARNLPGQWRRIRAWRDVGLWRLD